MGLVNWVVRAGRARADAWRAIVEQGAAPGAAPPTRHTKRLLHASFHRDPRAMIEDVMRGADATAWPRGRTTEANRAWRREQREAATSDPPPSRAGAPMMADDVILETEGLTKEFRGLRRRQGREPARAARHHPRPHRPQRRRQDHLLQPAHPLPRADRAAASASTAATSPGSRPADIARLGLVRSFQISAVFPHLTRAGERAHRAPAAARALVRLLALGAGARRRSTRARSSCSRRSGSATFAGHAGGRAALRPQARARDRHHARPRARDDAARRAHRGHGPRGRGAHLRAHQAGGGATAPC